MSRKKILIVANAFKGIASSPKVVRLLKNYLEEEGFFVKGIPLADGGDGSLDIVSEYINGKKFFSYALNAGGRRQQVPWLVKGKTVYIEMSRICGWKQKHKYESGLDTSSFGLGEVMLYALNTGAKYIYVFVGGSSSVDGGAGMIGGMGAPWGWVTARTLHKIDPFYPDNFLSFKATFHFLVDVNNYFNGDNGVVVYAPQKGIKTEEEMNILKKNLEYWDTLVKTYNPSAKDFAGGGAGGGVPYAGKNILGGKVSSGASFFIDIAKVRSYINDYDIIITGEGRWDETSLMGKLTGEIVKLAKEYGKESIVICGESRMEKNETDVYSIRDKQGIRITHLQRRMKKAFEVFAKYVKEKYG